MTGPVPLARQTTLAMLIVAAFLVVAFAVLGWLAGYEAAASASSPHSFRPSASRSV